MGRAALFKRESIGPQVLMKAGLNKILIILKGLKLVLFNEVLVRLELRILELSFYPID